MRIHVFLGVALGFIAGVPLSAQVAVARFAEPGLKYELRVEKNVMVSMRDQVRLATDLYFPVGVKEPVPVILLRTPYNKASDSNIGKARRYAEYGYIVAFQDVRGKFESEGSFTVSASDTNDGSDTVTWLAKQKWSNGKVGTSGCSYSGENTVEMSKLRNPGQVAMNPRAATGAMQYFGSWRGGAFELASDLDWFVSYGSTTKPADRANTATPPKVDLRALWRSLPLKGMLDRAGVPGTDWDDFVAPPDGGSWWRSRGYVTDSDKFDVPALFVDSWNDYGAGDVFRLADLIRKNSTSPRGAENQFIIVAPTMHCAYESASEHTIIGERDLGDARYPFLGLYLAWYDHWLKGVDNGIEKMPKIQLYVMGKNEWRGENEWPLARAVSTRYYFSSRGHANGRYGDGVLSTEQTASEPPDHLTYDPRTPVPSVGGPNWGGALEGLRSGVVDQSEVEMRQDVLVYTSELLEKGIEVTGPIEVVLNVSSDVADTDFTAKLVDVSPEGAAFNIQEGIQRMRYRRGFGKRIWMKPGETYEVHVGLNATSNYFSPGHRIRVEISSSNFPRFDRNLNTGGDNFSESSWRIAHNSVHHSGATASYIVLPVVP